MFLLKDEQPKADNADIISINNLITIPCLFDVTKILIIMYSVKSFMVGVSDKGRYSKGKDTHNSQEYYFIFHRIHFKKLTPSLINFGAQNINIPIKRAVIIGPTSLVDSFTR